MDSPLITSIIIIVGLLGLLAAGVWIFAAMLVVSIVGLYVLNDYSFVRIGSMLTSVQWKTMTSFELAALPLFVVAHWRCEVNYHRSSPLSQSQARPVRRGHPVPNVSLRCYRTPNSLPHPPAGQAWAQG